jgi:hypothetical protein
MSKYITHHMVLQMKTLIAITLCAVSLMALAKPIVSQKALNYSADQSVPPIATKPSTNPQPSTQQTTLMNKHKVIRSKHSLKKHSKHHPHRHTIIKK